MVCPSEGEGLSGVTVELYQDKDEDGLFQLDSEDRPFGPSRTARGSTFSRA